MRYLYYRKVTRKIYDFSPEQQQNLLAIVWLFRGRSDRFLGLVSQYLGNVVDEDRACLVHLHRLNMCASLECIERHSCYHTKCVIVPLLRQLTKGRFL